MLPRHPDTMTEEELEEWMLRKVRLKQEESLFLDYKQTVSVSTRDDKRELAKDVSSLANGRGGVLLYGIPEDRSSGAPVPVDESEIGMDPVEGLREDIENILVDTLAPRLPELRIRILSAPSQPGKVVYLVWHPESWEAPHMVHAYGEHRFYRRGNFRAVPMEEGEVERLYRRRQSRRELAGRFFEEADFGEHLLPQEHTQLRVAVCPGLPSENRVDFSREAWRDWLNDNALDESSRWIPFVEGVRFSSPAQYRARWMDEYRLFRNGAASFCSDGVAILEARELTVSVHRLGVMLARCLRFLGDFYQEAGIANDVLIDVAFLNMEGARLQFPGGMRLRADLDYQWHRPTLSFRLSAAATSLLSKEGRAALGERILNRFVQCFGMWNLTDQFRVEWI